MTRKSDPIGMTLERGSFEADSGGCNAQVSVDQLADTKAQLLEHQEQAVANHSQIPKTIHYIWFGGNPLGDKERACIESWKRYCPDYRIVRWDESNFDVRENQYCREAYEAGKWAFVSDYARLWVLVNEGGIYMDTDVEVTKPLDKFLIHEAFSGFETESMIPTGIMACRKGFPLFDQLLHDYDNRHFVKDDGSLDTTTNVLAITEACRERGFVPNGRYQVVDGFALYPKDWFCPKSYETGLINSTEHTHTIHHFAGSWVSPEDQEIRKASQQLLQRHPAMDPKNAARIAKVCYSIRHHDIRLIIKTLKRKLKGK